LRVQAQAFAEHSVPPNNYSAAKRTVLIQPNYTKQSPYCQELFYSFHSLRLAHNRYIGQSPETFSSRLKIGFAL
jgi:hypothetical protein